MLLQSEKDLGREAIKVAHKKIDSVCTAPSRAACEDPRANKVPKDARQPVAESKKLPVSKHGLWAKFWSLTKAWCTA